MRGRRLAGVSAAVLVGATGIALWSLLPGSSGPSSAAAVVVSECRNSCGLATQPDSSTIVRQLPEGTPVTMVCWVDAERYLTTNRWFKVTTPQGDGFTNADGVGEQARVRHC